MSTTLLKRTLELLEGDNGHSEKPSEEGGKILKRSKKTSRTVTTDKRMRSSSAWHTTDDVRRRLERNDRTTDNLRALHLLASGSVDENIANKILRRAAHKSVENTPVVAEEKTVFTDEDFEKFEREYFVANK